MSDWETVGSSDGWEDVGWEDATPKKKPASLLKEVGGVATGLGDIVSGILPFAAGTALAVGGTLSGEDPKIARKAAQEAASETYPVISESLKKFGIDATDTTGYKVVMSPFEAISKLIEQGGEKAGELTGSKEFGEGAKIAAELGMLGLGGVEGRIGKNVPKDFKGFEGKPEPITDTQLTPQSKVELPIPKEQLDMFDKDTSNNMYRAQQTAVDENGIPFNREASLEAQTTTRMGDLFDEGTLKEREAADLAEKNKQIEEAYRQKDEAQIAEAALIEQRKQVTQEPLTLEPTQSGINKGFRGKQSGAIDPSVITEGVKQFSDKLKDIVEKGGYKAALSHIAENGPNEFARETAKLLGKVKDQFTKLDVKSNLVIKDNTTGELKAVRGSYETANDTLTLSREYGAGDYQVVLHEGSHSATSAILDAYANPRLREKLTIPQRVSARNLNEIYTEIKDRIATGDLASIGPNGKPHYGLKNINEFIAEAFSSKSFQDFLKGITLKTGKTSVWNKFVDAVRKAIGLPESSRNALANTLSVGADLIERSTAESRDLYFGSKQAESVVGDSIKYSLQDDKLTALGKINSGWKKYIPTEKLDYESVAPTMRGAKDIDKPGYTFTNILTSGKMQSWMLDNPVVKGIVDMATGHINEAKLASEKALFDRNTGVVAKLNRIENLFSKGEAGAVLLERIAGQLNPEYIKNLSPEQLKIDGALESLFKDRAAKINEIMASMGRKPVKMLENYFPSRWKGEFVTALYERRSDGSRGRLLTYVKETSRGRAQQAADYLRSQYKDQYIISDVEHRPSMGKNKFQQSMSSAHADFETLLDLLGSEDLATIKANEAVQNLAAKQAMDTLNAKRHFKRKQGIEGSLGDKEWLSPEQNYRQAKESLIAYIESMDQWLAAHKINDFMKAMEKDPEVKAPNAVGFGRQFIDHALGYTEQTKAFKELQESIAKLTGKDTSLQRNVVMTYANIQTALYLGYYSARGAAQNIVQPFIGILPKLAEVAQRGGSKDVISPMLWGMTEAMMYLPYGITKGVPLTSAKPLLSKTGKAIWDYAIDRHIVDPHLIESRGTFQKKGAQRTYDIVANNSITVTEAFSRYAAFSSLVRHMVDSGLDLKTALRTAEDVSRELMVNYEPYAKAQVFDKAGIVGQMAGRLQSFKVNQLTQLVHYIKMAQKEGNWSGISTYLGTNIMVAGAVGMIGMDVAEAIWDLVKNVDRETGSPTPSIQEFSPREAALNVPLPLAVGGLSYIENKGLFGAFATNLIGDNAWQSMFPIYYGLGNQVASIPKLFSDSDTTFAAGLQAFAPASTKPYIEEAYLKGPEGQIKSSNTGRTVYTERPEEKTGYLKPNIPSLEKAETSLRSQLAFKREQSIKKSQDKLVTDMQKLMDDPKYENSKLLQSSFQKKLDRYIEFGGDINDLTNKLQSFIEGNAAHNQLEAKRNRELNNPNQSTLRTLEDIKRLEGRYGTR